MSLQSVMHLLCMYRFKVKELIQCFLLLAKAKCVFKISNSQFGCHRLIIYNSLLQTKPSTGLNIWLGLEKKYLFKTDTCICYAIRFNNIICNATKNASILQLIGTWLLPFTLFTRLVVYPIIRLITSS